MKIKLLFLMTLLFCVVAGYSQNTVTYSTLRKTIDLNSGAEGVVDILVNCYGSSPSSVFLNTMQSCGNNDGILSSTYTNGNILSPGGNTTLRYKFKKTVTANTQIVYKFSTDGSCFQEEKKMIIITVNYKAGGTTNPVDPINPNAVNYITFWDGKSHSQILSEWIMDEGSWAPVLTGIDSNIPRGYILQWQRKIENGAWTDVPDQQFYSHYDLINPFESAKYRRIANNNGIISISNELTFIVKPAPVLLNNTISISGSDIQGSTPTGGIGKYNYKWYVYVLEGEDPWLFEQNTKDFIVPESVYNFMGTTKVYVGREVRSGSQISTSNGVVVTPAKNIENNVLTLSGNNIIGSVPSGGVGIFKCEYYLYQEYDGEIIGEVELVGNSQNFPLGNYKGFTTKIYRKITSGYKVSYSNTITILPTGASAKTAIASEKSVPTDVTVYPNPTTQSVNFVTNFSANKEIEITIFSEGLRETKSIFRGTVTPNQIVNWNFPANYPKGLYFYKIMADNKEVKSGKISFQ